MSKFAAAVLLVCLLSVAARGSQAPARSVLMVMAGHDRWVSQYIDPRVKTELNRAGWQVGTAEITDLTWEQLRKFNVVVLCYMPPDTPAAGSARRSNVLDAKAPLLRKLLEAGGGILLLHDESYDQVFQPENRFLKPLGAEILNEEVTDPQHQWRQSDYLQYWFAWTTDITPDHPITRDVHTLWYPEGYDPQADRKTCALRVDGSWTVLAKAMPSAYSFRPATGTGEGTAGRQETYKSAPPLLAARQVGSGRLVLFPSSSSFTLQSGHHTIWQNIVLSRGDGQRASDTGRMLFNALGWLAEPSEASTELGGFIEPADTHAAGPDPAPVYSPARQPEVQQHTFRGLIGAHTALSDGQGSVADWAKAAKDKHLDFVVFTESFPPLTKGGWDQLRRECSENSDARMQCIPGIDYRDATGNRYVTFAVPQWFKDEWLSKAHPGRIGDTSGLYFGNDWSPLAVVETGQNPTKPWFLKFYGALAVYSYKMEGHSSRVQDAAMPLYLHLMGNQYNSVPIAFHDMHSPADLAADGGFLNCAWASKLSDVAKSYKHGWYAQPQSAYISEGPTLDAWWIDNGIEQGDAPQHGGRPWTLHIGISSEMPLRQVTIYDRQNIFRRFVVHDKAFSLSLAGLHDRQHFFVLVAEDEQGHRLISPTLRTAAARHSNYMCTDMQNTIEGGAARDRDGHWTFIGMLGNYITAWDGLAPGILVPGDELMPQGLDYVVKGFGGAVSHSLVTNLGNESAIARRDMTFGSGDCVVMDNPFTERLLPGDVMKRTALADSHVRLISFTPRIYSDNFILIERETVLKQAVRITGAPVTGLSMLNISGPEESFPNYVYVDADGKLVSGKRPAKSAVVVNDTALADGSYAALYPDFYGSVGVYPLSSRMRLPGNPWHAEPIHLHIQGANMSFGYSPGMSELPAGTRYHQSFLLVRAAFGDRSAEVFQNIRRAFGLDGSPAYTATATRGKIRHTGYMLETRADHNGLVLDLGQVSLPSDLPIRVAGLHDNWTTVCVDLPLPEDRASARWRAIGTLDGTAYLTADTIHQPRHLFIGHPVTCNVPQLVLNLQSWDDRGLTLEVHNPTDQAANANLVADPVFGGGSHEVRVEAGSSVMVHILWN